ncbi:MAG TPA: MATE family efflux transporter [Candidatus Krumholzibacteria bacterium]|nr:MATE family efflux transporter [Candidatus Krumholzibacteria bacterium]
MSSAPMHGRDMTQGPMTRHLLAVAWPVSVSFLVQMLYNLVDAFWLGKLGRAALVAPTISMNVVFIGIALAMGLGQAGTTLVSQYRGAGRPEAMGRAAGQSLVLQLVLGSLLAGVGLLVAPQLLRLLDTPADAYAETLTYLRWVLAGVPFMFVFHVYQGIYSGLGDTVGPMRINVATGILNVVLDPLLIFGWGPVPALGVAGAALATVAARGVAAALAVRALTGAGGFRLRGADLRPDAEMMRRLLRIGLPLSLGQTVTSLGFTLLIGIVNQFGSAATAAFGVGHRVVLTISVPAWAMAQANATAVGQNLGARLPERAALSVRTSAVLISVVLAPLCGLVMVFAAPLTRVFVDDPQVIVYGRELLRITAPSVFLFSLILVMFGAFQGAGKTVPVMVVNVARLWLVRIPFSWLLAVKLALGPSGLWWAMNLSNVLAAAAALVWFLRGDWKTAVIREEASEFAGESGESL